MHDSVAISLDETELTALRSAHEALEPHVAVEGDCQTSMFLGDCYLCAAYHALDDVLLRGDPSYGQIND